ncbi:hypothetical protein GC167_05570 [bacterium]|nr:hypothetical protein [bacterium]
MILLAAALLALPFASEAQCSMCRAVTESNRQSGGGWASGLNDGILYLMAFPYLLMGIIGIAWHRLKKSPKRAAEA